MIAIVNIKRMRDKLYKDSSLRSAIVSKLLRVLKILSDGVSSMVESSRIGCHSNLDETSFCTFSISSYTGTPTLQPPLLFLSSLELAEVRQGLWMV